jgi:hypothetical protein
LADKVSLAKSEQKVNDKTSSQATIKQATPNTPPDDFYCKLVGTSDFVRHLDNAGHLTGDTE